MATETVPAAAGAPAPDALPGQTGIPATSTADAAARSAGKGNGKRGPEIRIPQAAFKARVQREAAAEIRKRLGVSIEEAEKLIQAGGAPAAPAPAPAAPAVNTREIERLRQQAADAERKAQEWERKHKKDVTRLKDRQVETELRYTASKSGIDDADYALHLFARAAASGKADDPTKFFAGLKTSHAYLFRGAVTTSLPPAEVGVPPTTAPPESLAPGEVTPTPAAAGAPPPKVSIDDMNQQDFAKHTRQQYGFVPGT